MMNSKANFKSKTGKKTAQTNKRMKTTQTDLLADAEKRIAARARMMAAQKVASKSKLKTAVIPSTSHDVPASGKHPKSNTLSGWANHEDSAEDLIGSFHSNTTFQLQSNVNLTGVPGTTVKFASTSVNSTELKQAALRQLSKGQENQETADITADVMNKVTLLEPSDSPIKLESLRRALNGIWSAIEGLTKTQENMTLTQANMELKLDKLLRSMRATDSCKKPPSWPKELPLKSLAEMYKFENSLNEPEFVQFAVDYFSTSGGKTSEETARAVCICLFSKSLASTINIKGTTIKTGIKNLKIFQMIMDTCKLALNKTFELKRARSAVGVWLRNQSTTKTETDGESNSENDD